MSPDAPDDPEDPAVPSEADSERAAADAAEADDPAGHARQWLLDTPSATLCTVSAKPDLAGWPFGSIVPFTLTAAGRPVIYVAKIAAHTANLKHDPRASLFVHQPGLEGDPQRGWRITVMGTFEELVPVGAEARGSHPIGRVTEAELDDVHARYVERVPFAEDYRETHGFSYWRMRDVVKVRYIAGFGKICWIDGADVLRDPAGEGLGAAAPGAIAHMNEDHGHNLVEMCRGKYGFTPRSAEMIALDRAGFVVRTQEPDRTVYFPFGREITARELRQAVIDTLVRARATTGS